MVIVTSRQPHAVIGQYNRANPQRSYPPTRGHATSSNNYVIPAPRHHQVEGYAMVQPTVYQMPPMMFAPATLPPPIQAGNPLPKFNQLYEDFERMKRNGYVITPPPAACHVDANGSVAPSRGGGNLDDFAAAMTIFMQSYLPTAFFNCTRPSDDWSREAGNLLDELYSDDNRVQSSWPSTAVTTSAPTPQLPRVDIHRHILDHQVSPYPGGSPIPSTRSANSSDCDADDEGVSPLASPTGKLMSACKAIGRRPLFRKKLREDKPRLSMDSGYQSSSTESGRSYYSGSPASSGIDSDECSSRLTADDVMSDDVTPYLHAILENPWLEQNTSDTTPPHTPQPPQKHKKWITREILDMIGVRDRLYKRMKKHPAPDIVDMYKKVRNMVVGMTRNAKRNHDKKYH